MERVFADTSYWIAFLNPRDDLHETAVAVSRSFVSGQIVTSEMVLAELLDGFSSYGPRYREAAVHAVQQMRATQEVLVVGQTSALFEKAFKIYQDATDKSWSLTDGASFSIMREEQLASALTHDRHFTQAGFQALLR